MASDAARARPVTPRHAAINDVIKRALTSSRTHWQRPDGATIMPWKCGRVLTWDATCPDTFAPSHSVLATSEAGAVANEAEKKKATKYSSLSSTHHFIPIAIETSGVFGLAATSFFRHLANRIKLVTGEPKSHNFLLQRVSEVIQRRNAASILGTALLP